MNSFLKNVFGGGYSSDKQDQSIQQPQQNSSTQQQQTSPDSNTQNNLVKEPGVWDSVDDPTQATQQNQQTTQTTQQTQAADPQETLRKHIDSLNLTNGIDFTQIQQDLQTGNSVESIQKAFATIAENTYKSAMTQMNNLVDAKVDAAKQAAIQESSASLNKNLAVREMERKLPFTTDPDLSPVAKAVLNQYLARNVSLEDAIKKTETFFKSAANKVAGINSKNIPGDSGFNRRVSSESLDNNNNSNDNPSSHEEWVSLLSAQR